MVLLDGSSLTLHQIVEVADRFENVALAPGTSERVAPARAPTRKITSA